MIIRILSSKVFFFILLWCLPFSALAKDVFDMPVFESVGVKASLGLLSNTSVGQDEYGFIWIATQAGLVRYDSDHFTPYMHTPEDPFSISSHDIRTLLGDKNNNIWAGNYRHGIALLNPKTEQFTHLLEGKVKLSSASHVRVYNMFEQPGLGVWAAWTDGDCQGKVMAHYVMSDTNNMLSNPASALLFDGRQRLLVGFIDGLQVLNDDGTSSALLHSEHELDITAHIPIVLLTAKGDEESPLARWKLGVDNDVTKPFNRTELQARLSRLISVPLILSQRQGRKTHDANERQQHSVYTTISLLKPVDRKSLGL
jgi:ligand-binding sensor domain-containing protein